MGAAFPTLPLFTLLALALGTLMPARLQVIIAALLAPAILALAVPEPVRSQAIQRWLETRYDRSGMDTLTDPVGIIVPGGGLATYVVDAALGLPLDDRGRSGRITGAAALAMRFPQANIIHAGVEQASARDAFAALGIARERVIVEERSGTTYENAILSAALLKPRQGQRWILVTSASHMPRAMATFRSVGFDVVAYPVDYEADPDNASPEAAARGRDKWWPRGRREALAILNYLATGRIKPWSLFLSPPA